MRPTLRRALRSRSRVLAVAEAIEARTLLSVGAPVGFGAAATGGAGGSTVTVSTAADFKSYAERAGKYVIKVNGSLNVGSIRVTSDKTIEGDGDDALVGSLGLYGVNNVVVQNLAISNPAGVGEGDGITIKDGTTNVWVDHCSVFDTTDGLIDVTQGSDLVTLSWNKLYYTTAGSHHFSVLIGASDTSTGDRGKLRVTLHHNWWANNVVERMPSVRFGDVHAYNNFYSSAGNNYAIRSRIEAEVLIENNSFENVKDPYYVYVASAGETIGRIRASGNAFANTTGKVDDGNDNVFKPGYAYTLDPAGSVKQLVTGGAGVGKLSAAPAELGGALIGTGGSFANAGNTIAKAVDNNLSSFFDAPVANGAWVGRDLGSAATVTSVQFAPRGGWAYRMTGGVFQGSNSASFAGAVTLATIATKPAEEKLTTLTVSGASAYRYVRYLAPSGAYGNIAELKFFGTPGGTTAAAPLTGTYIGTSGSFANAGNVGARLFDGNVSTFFDAPTASGAWAGLDLGSAKSITSIKYAPRGGWAGRMIGGRFEASNSATFASGVVTLATISTKPAEGTLTSVAVSVAGSYRYVRYVGPAGAYGNASEVQFFG